MPGQHVVRSVKVITGTVAVRNRPNLRGAGNPEVKPIRCSRQPPPEYQVVPFDHYPTATPMNITQTALLRTAEDLLDVLTDDCDVEHMKAAVASLVWEHLEMHQPAPGSEQKLYLVNAVGALCRKGDAGERLTVADLRTSVLGLTAAITADRTAASDMPPGRVSELITYNMLRRMAQHCAETFSDAFEKTQTLAGNTGFSERYRVPAEPMRGQKKRSVH